MSLLAGLLLIGCNPKSIETKTDAQGVTIQLPPVWRSSIAANDKYIAEDIDVPVVSEQGVLFPKSKPPLAGQPRQHICMVLKNRQTGEDVWEWDDFDQAYQNVYIIKSYQDDFSNIYYWGDGSRGYGIDMKTGRTAWKKVYKEYWAGVPRVASKGYFYVPLNSKENYNNAIWKPKLYVGTLEEGSVEPFISPTYSASVGQPGGGYKQNFTGINGVRVITLNNEPHLLFDYYDATHPTLYWYIPRISLYNLTQKKFVYEGLPMKDAGYLLAVNGHLQINNGKVYDAMARFTVCHDLLTGKQLWERAFGSLTDYQLAFEDKLMTYISDGSIYCLNADTGQTLWRKEGVVQSNFAHLNGVVYFAASKALWACEASTGKVLWKLESPDRSQNSSAVFKGFVAAVGGKGGQKGRIYAHTGLNAYCYEAIR